MHIVYSLPWALPEKYPDPAHICTTVNHTCCSFKPEMMRLFLLARIIHSTVKEVSLYLRSYNAKQEGRMTVLQNYRLTSSLFVNSNYWNHLGENPFEKLGERRTRTFTSEEHTHVYAYIFFSKKLHSQSYLRTKGYFLKAFFNCYFFSVRTDKVNFRLANLKKAE